VTWQRGETGKGIVEGKVIRRWPEDERGLIRRTEKRRSEVERIERVVAVIEAV
jgi:hypothetical protein